MPDPTSRRGLLGRLVPVDATLLEVPARRRPPGAVAELEFLTGCTACGDCVRACPQRAIHTLADWVDPGAGTPVMVPQDRPCHMCEGFPCIVACGEGVLLPVAGVPKIGAVSIDASRCLPFLGPECGACFGVCPAGVSAIELVGSRPIVDEDTCLGCGLCIEACPTRPAALEMIPL